MADCPETCLCKCTSVIVDPSGTPVEVDCEPGTPPDPRCLCELSGSKDTTSVDMWVADIGLMYIDVTHGGATYYGICEGTVCVNGWFTCGGNVTLYDEDLNTLTVEINGYPCQCRDCSECNNLSVVISGTLTVPAIEDGNPYTFDPWNNNACGHGKSGCGGCTGGHVLACFVAPDKWQIAWSCSCGTFAFEAPALPNGCPPTSVQSAWTRVTGAQGSITVT